MTQRSFPPGWPQPATGDRPSAEPATTSEIIELAWSDEVSFDSIERQTGMAEADVIALMRSTLKPGSFRAWRKRVSGRKAKHDAQMDGSA